MPSNTAPERSEAPASSSKASLLWAYQLRREHVHLLDRIEDMNTQLISSANNSHTCQQNLSNLEGLVKTLQAENHTLKNEVTLVRTKLTSRIEDINQQITQIVSNESVVKDVTKQLELDFRSMGLQVSDLSKSLSQLTGDIANMANQQRAHAAQEIDVAPTQDNTELAKVESVSEQVEARPKRIVKLFLGQRRKHLEQPLEPAAEITNIRDSSINQTALFTVSTLTDLAGPLIPDPKPPTNSYDHIFQQIHQKDRTISDYLVFTSELRSQLPRRKQEGHIVEAFFDGLTDDSDGAVFKTSLEEYLNETGWTWANLEVFCKPRALRNRRRAIYNTRARSRANALARQKEETGGESQTR